MQPAAAEIEGNVRCGHDGVGATADAVARFEHDGRETGILQRARGAEACGARADDGDIDLRGEGHISDSPFADSFVKGGFVSRTRCSVLHAAPQSRDPALAKKDGPRISSAPRRKGGALRSIRGTRPL